MKRRKEGKKKSELKKKNEEERKLRRKEGKIEGSRREMEMKEDTEKDADERETV